MKVGRCIFLSLKLKFPEMIILKIGDHMQYQANGNNPVFAFKKDSSEQVEQNHRIGMKQMKPDTPAVCLKNRNGPQMIQIYEHCTEHQ